MTAKDIHLLWMEHSKGVADEVTKAELKYPNFCDMFLGPDEVAIAEKYLEVLRKKRSVEQGCKMNFASTIVLCELYEAFVELKNKNYDEAIIELRQVACVCIRLMMDISMKKLRGEI